MLTHEQAREIAISIRPCAEYNFRTIFRDGSLQEELDRLTAEFLARGGKIKTVADMQPKEPKEQEQKKVVRKPSMRPDKTEADLIAWANHVCEAHETSMHQWCRVHGINVNTLRYGLVGASQGMLALNARRKFLEWAAK